MAGHHLILGKLVDYLTGKTIVDTHDERLRQKIARVLVEEKGYAKTQIEPSRVLTVAAGNHRGIIHVDFCIRIENRVAMLVKYGPGSLVTRYRPALAIAQLTEAYLVPYVVVTNGKDAHLLDVEKGMLLSQGFMKLPTRQKLSQMVQTASFDKISRRRAEMAARIVYCFEIDGSCPCDDKVHKLYKRGIGSK